MSGAIIGAALLVALLCGYAPAHLPWIFPFVFNPVIFLGCWFTLLWYVRGMRRIAPAARPHYWRQAAFLIGLGSIYLVLQTHFEYLAQHLFLLNRTQAVVTGMAGPFLIGIGWMGDVLGLGAPAWAVAAARRIGGSGAWRVLTHPVVAMAIFVAVSDAWLWPPLHFAAMIDPALYAAMNLSGLLGGLLFWLVVLDPRPKPPARFSYLFRAGAGFLVMFPQIGISSYIALTQQDLYAFYSLCGRILPGVSPASDQLIGGMIQWIPPGLLNTAVLLLALNSLRLSDIKTEATRLIPPEAKVYEASWTGRRN